MSTWPPNLDPMILARSIVSNGTARIEYMPYSFTTNVMVPNLVRSEEEIAARKEAVEQAYALRGRILSSLEQIDEKIQQTMANITTDLLGVLRGSASFPSQRLTVLRSVLLGLSDLTFQTEQPEELERQLQALQIHATFDQNPCSIPETLSQIEKDARQEIFLLSLSDCVRRERAW